MDYIYIIKALMIGILGAGGFYFMMAFSFQYFPLPIFLYVRARIATYAAKKHKKEGDFGAKIWQIGRFFMILTLLLVWWGIFGIYAYGLHQALTNYLPNAESYFWTYYGIAIAIPALWALVKFIRFFFAKKETTAIIIEKDERPFLEQINS